MDQVAETGGVDSVAIRERFAESFGGEPEVVVRAPGRVNLIGEHTDYSEGWVMPAAIDRATWVAARVGRGLTRLDSREAGAGDPFDAGDARPGTVAGWARYAAAVAWALRQEGFEDVPNLEAAVVSDVPQGAGLSSSAALEVAFAVAWDRLGGHGLTGLEIARLARLGENRFVGVACGIMDPLASALGRRGCAMQVDTRSLEVVYAPLPDAWQIVVCDTGMPRTLAGSAYNERRLEVERAAQILGIATLRDATLEAVASRANALGDRLTRRARHVVSENGRVEAFAQALRAGDASSVRAAMLASHASLRDDFEVSSTELDAMAEAALEAPGCVGARLTGAGFGGACVALVEAPLAEDFQRAAADGYRRRTGLPGSFLAVSATDGAARGLKS